VDLIEKMQLPLRVTATDGTQGDGEVLKSIGRRFRASWLRWESSVEKQSHHQLLLQRGVKMDFFQVAKSGEISFLTISTYETTFFAKTLKGKCQISKSSGA